MTELASGRSAYVTFVPICDQQMGVFLTEQMNDGLERARKVYWERINFI